MTDTLERMAETAQSVARGHVTQGLAFGALRCGAATEFRARRLYNESLAAFKSNLLDAADLSPAFRDNIYAFLKQLDATAPTLTQWDEAMAEKAGNQ